MTAAQLKKRVTGAARTARTAGGTTTGTGPASGAPAPNAGPAAGPSAEPSAISERYNTHQDKIIRKILKLMPPLLEISINRRQSAQRRGEKEEKTTRHVDQQQEICFFQFHIFNQ
jgi:hypothetical protein